MNAKAIESSSQQLPSPPLSDHESKPSVVRRSPSCITLSDDEDQLATEPTSMGVHGHSKEVIELLDTTDDEQEVTVQRERSSTTPELRAVWAPPTQPSFASASTTTSGVKRESPTPSSARRSPTPVIAGPVQAPCRSPAAVVSRPLQGSSTRPLTCSTCGITDSAIWTAAEDGRPLCASCDHTALQPAPGQRSRSESVEVPLSQLPINIVAPTPAQTLVVPTATLGNRLRKRSRTPAAPVEGQPQAKRSKGKSKSNDVPRKRARIPLDVRDRTTRRPPTPPPLSGFAPEIDYLDVTGMQASTLLPEQGQRTARPTKTARSASRHLTRHSSQRRSQLLDGSSSFVAPDAIKFTTLEEEREEAWDDAMDREETHHRTQERYEPRVIVQDDRPRPAPKNWLGSSRPFETAPRLSTSSVRPAPTCRSVDLPYVDPSADVPSHRMPVRPVQLSFEDYCQLVKVVKVDKNKVKATAVVEKDGVKIATVVTATQESTDAAIETAARLAQDARTAL